MTAPKYIKEIDLDAIPSPPGVASALLELFQEDDVDRVKLEKVISADLALSAKIIQYCNSPVFGLAKEITSLGHAMVALGLKKVRTIALSFSLIDLNQKSDVDFETFWNRSLATAISVQATCENADENGDHAFLVGLVLNVGQLIMEINYADYSIADSVLSETIGEVVAKENHAYGSNRFEIGSLLLESWNFPNSIVKTIRGFCEYNDETRLCDCIDLGFQMAAMFFDDNLTANQIEWVREFATETMGFDFDLERVFDSANEQWVEFSKLLQFAGRSRQCLRDLELRARQRIVSYSLSQFDEQEVIELENESLNGLIHTDEQTGLLNRRFFENFLQIEFFKATQGNNLALAMIDIDHFKRVNDTYGHLIGDEALVHVAKLLGKNIRKTDMLCRYGGEEFVILMPGCRAAEALIVGERIRSLVESNKFRSSCQQFVPITVSIGIASFGLESNLENCREFLERADKNLYRAKKTGRNICAW